MNKSKCGIFGMLLVLLSMLTLIPGTSAREGNTICVIKFYDINSNGIYDNSDFPLANWSVFVKGVSPAVRYVKQYDITGADGIACFSGLANGTYWAGEERLPRGWIVTTRPISIVTLPGNSDPAIVYVGNKVLFGPIPTPPEQET